MKNIAARKEYKLFRYFLEIIYTTRGEIEKSIGYSILKRYSEFILINN